VQRHTRTFGWKGSERVFCQTTTTTCSVWQSVPADYASPDFNWLSALVGTTCGQSLRDIAVHRSVLNIDAMIDDRDRGVFVLEFNTRHIRLRKKLSLYQTQSQTGL